MGKRIFAALVLAAAMVSTSFAATAPDTLWSTATPTGIAIKTTAINASGEIVIAGVTAAAPLNVACFKQAGDKSFTWTTNRFDLNGRGATLASLKVNGMTVTSSKITIVGSFAMATGSDTLFVLQIDPATGTQTSLFVANVGSRAADIVKSGSGYVVLGTSVSGANNLITTWAVDSAAVSVSATPLTALANYIPGTIKVASNGWNIFTCSTVGGVLYLKGFNGTTQTSSALVSGSADTTYMSSSYVILNSDIPFVTYTETGSNGAKAAIFNAAISTNPSVQSITSIISSAQVRGVAQDAFGYIVSGTFSNKIWLSRITLAGALSWQYQSTVAGRIALSKCLVLRTNGEAVYGAANGTTYYIQNSDREGIATFTPNAVSFSSERGATLPASQNVLVGNSNSATFGSLIATISYGSGSNWLQVGVTGTGNAQTIANSVTTNNLTVGSYSATVVVTGNYLRTATSASYSVTLVISDTTKPTVNITTPSAIRSNTTTTIKWTATDASGVASRLVEAYNGSQWVTVGTPTADTILWAVPTLAAPTDSARYRVTIVDASPNANTTVSLSMPFRIDTAITNAPVVTISMPAQLSMGTTYQVTWTESAPSSPIASRVLLFSQNNGTTYDTLASPTSNSYIWTIPSTPINQCRMRIVATAVNSRVGTGTSGQFAILDLTPPSVSGVALAPSGNNKYRAGSIQEIDWVANDNVNVTRRIIAYSTNGTTWNQISDENSNTGVYVWTVPTDTADNAYIKVTVYDARGNTNFSVSAGFKIVSAITGIAGRTFNVSDYFGISTMGKTVRLGVNAGAYNVKVYDVAGRLMMSRNAVASQGMYQSLPVMSSSALIVRLEQAGKMLTKKVMPQ